MRKLLAFCFLIILTGACFAQHRETAAKINDLVHTKLAVNFNYEKAWLYGKEWLTLKPHFYPTDSLELDAKQMDIAVIQILRHGIAYPLQYSYDGWHLNIHLDKVYVAGEKYTIYIEYTAKPQEAEKPEGWKRGLNFVKISSENTEIWTDGETEYTSFWCPTIDKPNQKTSFEIFMTVPSKYTTLSNGALIRQQKNPDGSRTDQWKMNLPVSPYVFFYGGGGLRYC